MSIPRNAHRAVLQNLLRESQKQAGGTGNVEVAEAITDLCGLDEPQAYQISQVIGIVDASLAVSKLYADIVKEEREQGKPGDEPNPLDQFLTDPGCPCDYPCPETDGKARQYRGGRQQALVYTRYFLAAAELVAANAIRTLSATGQVPVPSPAAGGQGNRPSGGFPSRGH